MKEELKLIVNIKTNKRVYMYNNNYISVDRFNDILDSWEFMGYNIKKYDMRKGNQHIFVWYVK